jgi:hypothetical protein
VEEFSVIHYLTGARETVSRLKSVAMVNNGTTCLGVTASLDFNKLKVEKPAVTNIKVGMPFYAQLAASGGQPPYQWELVKDYGEKTASTPYQTISGDTLSAFGNEKEYQRVNLPFEFPFYGNKYKSLVADIKGSLYFENEYIQYPYVIDPELIFRVRKSIVPFGAAIAVNEPGDLFLWKATDSVVTFEWRASVYHQLKVYPLQLTASLYPDGRIVYRYGRRSIPSQTDYPWQIGICNGDQSLYKYATISASQLLFEDYSITFTPSDYPANLTLSNDGTLSGLASAEDHLWNILVKVTDSYNQVKYSSIPISTVAADTVARESRTFPNPFRRSTGISFKVIQDSPVTLDIYDFAGRHVQQILNKTLTAGDFTYYWNARDASNRDVNPGTYIYRLRIGGHVESGKMVLVR